MTSTLLDTPPFTLSPHTGTIPTLPLRTIPAKASPGKVVLVQGGFWGSESKGLVTAYVTERYRAAAVVRTGCINAGHTVVHGAHRVVLQTLPCGWTNPDTMLVIGPGAYIHPETLQHEIELLEGIGVDVKSRLLIDYRVALHTSDHMVSAKNADRHTKMGATGKGSSEAVVAKIRDRGTAAGRLLFQSQYGAQFERYRADTSAYLNQLVDLGGTVVLEATQGTLLDLHLGPYPYTTHKPTSPGLWLAEAGLAPSLLRETWMVVRSYPIRVAGNSGPMPGELEWEELADSINTRRAKWDLDPIVKPESLKVWREAVRAVIDRHNGPVASPSRWSETLRVQHRELLTRVHGLALDLVPDDVARDLRNLFEFTTVTRKLRRIARLDVPTLYHSAQVNRPTHIFYTFTNYDVPYYWYSRDSIEYMDNYREFEGVGDFLSQRRAMLQSVTGAESVIFSMGPDHNLHTL